MKILSVVAVAALVFTGIAGAADDKAAASAPAGSLEAPEMQVGMRAQVFGKVISMHSCEMAGTSDPHMLVKLESAPGDVEIVDLGSTAELKSNGIELREGQQLWIDGRIGRINGKPLVVALNISESKLVSVSRKAPLIQETTKHAAAEHADGKAPAETPGAKDPKAPKVLTVDASLETRFIEGTVIHTRHVRIEGEEDSHILAKVKTENGIVVLDLGSCMTIPKTVDLTEGKTIAASGIVGDLNGRPIILAESVGNMSAIQISNQPANVNVPDVKNEK